jgi:hypothetical protein
VHESIRASPRQGGKCGNHGKYSLYSGRFPVSTSASKSKGRKVFPTASRKEKKKTCIQSGKVFPMASRKQNPLLLLKKGEQQSAAVTGHIESLKMSGQINISTSAQT